jgi:hypothetical protein
MNQEQPGQHDGTRYSTAHTPLREASEKWQAFLDEMRDRLSVGEYGRLVRENDPATLRRLVVEVTQHARMLHAALGQLRWPTLDQVGSLQSDERAFEQAARYLEQGHGQFAWNLVFSALTRAHEWRQDNYFSSLGIDLNDYFRAEADATLRVLQNHHLELMAQAKVSA